MTSVYWDRDHGQAWVVVSTRSGYFVDGPLGTCPPVSLKAVERVWRQGKASTRYARLTKTEWALLLACRRKGVAPPDSLVADPQQAP